MTLGVHSTIPGSDVMGPNPFRPSSYGLSDMLMITFLDFIANSKIVTIKSIHPSLTIPVSTSVSQILDCIQANPNKLEFHLQLFLFPYAVLCAMPTAVLYKIRRRNRNAAQRDYTAARLSAWVSNKYQVMGELLSHPEAPVYPVQAAFGFRPPHSVLSNLRRAEKLVREDGQFGKAVKTLQSKGLAPINEETKRLLQQEKHPAAPPPPQIPLSSSSSRESAPPGLIGFTVSAKQVLKQLQSFPKGTACGKSGWRVVHYIHLFTVQRFSLAFTSLVNIFLMGLCDPSVSAQLYVSGNLIPLLKKDVDVRNIRPIVVGEVFRRLVSKLCTKQVAKDASAFLQPLQFGVGIRSPMA